MIERLLSVLQGVGAELESYYSRAEAIISEAADLDTQQADIIDSLTFRTQASRLPGEGLTASNSIATLDVTSISCAKSPLYLNTNPTFAIPKTCYFPLPANLMMISMLT